MGKDIAFKGSRVKTLAKPLAPPFSPSLSRTVPEPDHCSSLATKNVAAQDSHSRSLPRLGSGALEFVQQALQSLHLAPQRCAGPVASKIHSILVCEVNIFATRPQDQHGIAQEIWTHCSHCP